MDSHTLFVSLSLFCLPLLALCLLASLPLVVLLAVNLYLAAWLTEYSRHINSSCTSWIVALTHLPCHPSTVMQINHHLATSVLKYAKHLPHVLSYMYWRYWAVRAHIDTIVRRDVVYSVADPATCKLDVYYPDNGKPAPTVVFLHDTQDPSLPNHRLFCSMFADTLRQMGYIVVVPDIRPLASEANDDVKEAVRWAYHHARETNGDVEMIYTLGHGTGAQRALQVVFADMIDKAKLYANDIHTYKHDPAVLPMQHHIPQVEGMLLFAGSYDESMELVEENSALFATSLDILDFFPRILFVHGEKDTVCPSEASVKMYNLIGQVLPTERREEVDVRMKMYRNLGHSQCIAGLVSNYWGHDTMLKFLLRDLREFVDVDETLG